MYDREFRQLQATMGMHWEVDIRHLSDIHLREKPSQESHAQTRRTRANLANRVRGDLPTQNRGLKSVGISTGGPVTTTTASLLTLAPSALKHTPHHPMTRETGGSTRQYDPG